jgi:TonB-dependent SusC/RagA subfamily outer membrane receptor
MNLPVYHCKKCLFLIIAVMLAACSGTRNTGSSGLDPNRPIVDEGYQSNSSELGNQSNIMVRPNEEKPSNLSLTEMLQRLPGVRAQGGQGAYAKFIVDGASGSFMSGTDPLFVVNGRVIGTDYSFVYTMVNPLDVTSVSVLKGADASIYGSRGANGVILIRTKK